MKCLIIALALSSALQLSPQYRTADVKVDEVHSEYGTVSFVDSDGELWVVESNDVSGYVPGNEFTLVYDTMGTDYIYDDEIVAVAKAEVVYAEDEA